MGSLNKKSSITFLGLSIDVVYLLKIIVKENVVELEARLFVQHVTVLQF